MNASAIILNSIEFVEKDTYKIKFLTHNGGELIMNAYVSKHPLADGSFIKGVNFSSDEIGRIAAHCFVDLRVINSAICAFHDAQNDRFH